MTQVRAGRPTGGLVMAPLDQTEPSGLGADPSGLRYVALIPIVHRRVRTGALAGPRTDTAGTK